MQCTLIRLTDRPPAGNIDTGTGGRVAVPTGKIVCEKQSKATYGHNNLHAVLLLLLLTISLSESSADVASSSNRIRGLANRALAMATRCF